MPAQVTCHVCRYEYADSALFCANCGTAKVRDLGADPLLGKVLGERFLIQEKLGAGTSGTIYRAEHVTLRRRVAVKVLHHELSRDDLALERFRREATSVGELDNDHIVEIHDFGKTVDGRLYLAMELLDGETLDAVLAREKTLSVEQTADILIQVGDALAEAHAIGFIHRDLRPRNVFLAVRRGHANFVKLFDFGLAKLVEPDAQAASTSLGMTFGDPRYMSPEQARGDRIDRRADIYQLGCLAYEMLTGAPPFVGTRVFDVLTKHVNEAPAPLPSKRPGVPLWLEASVARMLAKQPSDRFATITRMVEALRMGLATGEVMDEARVKRPDTTPPAVVTQALARSAAAAAELAATPLPTLGGPSPLTVSGNAAASVSSAMSPVAVGEVTSRPRTATPRAGVPVSASISAPVAAAVAPVAAVATMLDGAAGPAASTTGKLPRPGSRAPSAADMSDSGAWFATGDQQSAEDDRAAIAAEAERRRERARNLIAPTRTSKAAASASASFDDEFLPQRDRRLAYGAVGLLGVGLIAAVIFMATRSNEIPKAKEVAAAPPPPVVVDARPPDANLAAMAGSGSGSAIVAAVVPTATGSGKAPATVDMSAGPAVTASGGTRTTGGGTRTTDTGGRTTDTGSHGPRDPSGAAPVDPYAGGNTGGGTTTDPSGAGPVDPYAGGGSTGSAPTTDLTPTAEAARYASAGDRALRSGDAATAAANYRRALELDDGNLAATIGLGEVAAQQGLASDAVSHLKRAARLAPGSARVQILLGEAYLNSGDKKQAETAFRKALSIDPDSARAQGGLNDAIGG